MDRTSGPKRAGGGVGGNKEGSVTRDRDTANSKAIGLNEKLIMQIQEYPELHSLLRLHELNKKVEAKKAGKKIGGITPLQRSGYKKHKKCELCGFRAQAQSQLDVFFVDGSMRNTATTNLKTVCANCQRLSSIRKLGWRIGDLVADD